MSRILLLNGEAVHRLLDMTACIDAMAEAMLAVSNRTVAVPKRLIGALQDRSGLLAVMPGSSLAPPVFGAKVVSLLPGNPQHGRPAIQGFIALFDHATGAPVALVEGGAVTAIRTAAASGLATRLLAREDVRSHGILGTGVQAVAHIDAILAARPGIEETRVWGRDHAKASELAEQASRRFGRRVRAVREPWEASECDVVSTVTGASQPILHGKWLRPGAHVNLVGAHRADAREADTATITRSDVYVDSRDSALAEAGDLLIPAGEGAWSLDAMRGEIGEVVAGGLAGRAEADAITLYKSVGIFAQDLYAAWRVTCVARERGEGALVEW